MGRKTSVTRPLRADSRERPALTLTLDSTDKRRARTGSANADALSLPDLKDGVSREISDEKVLWQNNPSDCGGRRDLSATELYRSYLEN